MADRTAQRRTQTAPSRCADLLVGSLQGLGLHRVIRHLALLRAWDRVVAGRIRERARVEDFKGGSLYLCVEDPVWLHELHMLRHRLKTLLNQEIGEPVVSEIVLRIGRTRRYSQRRTPNAECTKSGQPQGQTVSPAVEERMAELLSPLKDLPCCEAVQRLFERWASRPL